MKLREFASFQPPKKKVKFDPVVPNRPNIRSCRSHIENIGSCRYIFELFDPVVPKLKLNLRLSFQIQNIWSCRSEIQNIWSCRS